MNIGEFTSLSREDQFKAAGSIAGVDPSVFDGIWRTESSRGANMLSPAGAKGHFGLMDATRKVWEGRFGANIDPMDFGQSLYTSAHTLKENLGKFKDLPKALRAYNGGWDESKWGNAETSAYVGKVLGSDFNTEPADIVPAVKAEPVPSAATLWDRPFQDASRPAKPGSAKLTAASAAVAASLVAARPTEPSNVLFAGASGADAAASTASEQEKRDTDFIDMARAGGFRGGIQSVMRAFARDNEPVDPSFEANEEAFKDKGYSQQQLEDLRSSTSEQQMQRKMFDIQYGREQDAVAFRHGAAWGIGASMLADLPLDLTVGVAASLGLRAAGVGSYAIAAAQGRTAGLVASAGEGALGNVAVTGLLDIVNGDQTTTDYVLGVAGGVLSPLLEMRALGRVADNAAEIRASEALLQAKRDYNADLLRQATQRAGPDATPEDIARIRDEIETTGVRVEQASHTAAIPENRRMPAGPQDEADILPAAETAPKAPEAPAADAPPPVPDYPDPMRAAPESLDAAQIKLHSGGVLSPENWADLPTGVHLAPNLAKRTDLTKQVETLQELAQAYLPGARIVIAADNSGNTKAAGNILSIGDTHMIRLGKGGRMDHTAMHEFGHAVYSHHAGNAPPELLGRMKAEYDNFLAGVKARNPDAWENRWAVTAGTEPKSVRPTKYNKDQHEFFAEQFVKHLQSKAIAGGLGGRLPPKIIDRVVKGLEAVLKLTRDLIGRKVLKPGKAADEFFSSVLEGSFAKRTAQEAAGEVPTVRMDTVANGPDAVPADIAKEVAEFINDPVGQQFGLHLLPMGTPAERAEAKQILGLYKKAVDPKYVVDTKRLSKLLSLEAFSALEATSNIMLKSKNPVMRMAAIELLENGAGAGGRRSTAAIAKTLNERAIIGDSIGQLDRAFSGWFKGQPDGSWINEGLKGTQRKRFDRLMAEEIEQRGKKGAMVDYGPHVRAGVDAMEAGFERARLMQVDAKTIGWAALPETSRGYMPHRMKSLAVRNLTQPQLNALHAEFTDQFINISGFDPTFADQLASRYIDRMKVRALGGFDSPTGAHQPGAADAIRQALEDMNLPKPELEAMMKKHFAGAANHTKKRLKIDLMKEVTASDGSTFRLMDLYDTDSLSLLRSQSQRVGGEVALARHGVMGKPGMAVLKRAAMEGNLDSAATRKEMDAMDQVFAELLGEPFGTANKWVDRAVQYNSLSSLGGMGFNQLGEIINAAATLGVGAVLQNIAGAGRLRAEIKAMARGQKVNNAFLSSIETMGGAEFGTDAYKMVFPMDNHDLFQNSMGPDTLATVDRLLRGGLHLQGKLSLWRTIHSTQVRGVAEQIVMKAAKAIHSGSKADFHLADMGLADDILDRIGKDVIQVKDGKVVGFDITKAKDQEAAYSFIQGVHRGSSQIIQGTFTGETGKYIHSSWLRMMTQFRTFSITAIDKQWNRQVANRGAIGAAVLLMASMSVAAPLYMARTYLSSIGRDDQQEYLDKHLTPLAIGRATSNYVASAGLGGDFLDAITAVTGTGEATGGRSGTNQTLVGNLVAPAAGKVDKMWGAVQNTREGTDLAALLKQGPFARLPYLIPVMNALGN